MKSSIKNLFMNPSSLNIQCLEEKISALEELTLVKNIHQKGFNVNIYEHCLLTFSNALELVKGGGDEFIDVRFVPPSGTSRCATFLFSSLIHDVGKGKIKKSKDGLYIGHEILGAEMALELSAKCGFQEEESFKISKFVLYHIEPAYLAIYSKKTGGIREDMVKQFIARTGTDAIDIILLAYCDASGGRLIDENLLIKLKKFICELLRYVEAIIKKEG